MPFLHRCHHCGKHLSRKQNLDNHIARYHGGKCLESCQVGDDLAKIYPEKTWSASGEIGLTDSVGYINQFQNNLERGQQTPQPSLPDPLASSLSSLDQTMQAILQNPSVGDDYTKAQHYSQALQRYLRQADQYRERPLGKVTLKEIDSVGEDKSEKDVSQIKELLKKTLPPTLIRGGTTLADTLADLPEVSWDDKLQLIVDGKTVQSSNVVDLLSDLARKKKTTKPPKGMDTLLDVLKARNIAKSLIINETRRSALDSTRPVRSVPSRKIKPKLPFTWTEKKYKNGI